jgi:G3E family GTPase
MIPVSVLTGFLGSGKTTLLARLLKSPQFSRTAVIINEFGEVGLDHDLIETSEESFVQLQTGCLCCHVRGDLALTLENLLARRAAGTVPAFERIVIETSGLADPAPILQALMVDGGLSQQVTLAGVVTTVDAINGLATLKRQPESLKQVAAADRLLLTKTDLITHNETGGLSDRLSTINPAAEVLTASFGDIDPGRLFDSGAAADRRQTVAWMRADQVEAPHGKHHDTSLTCFAILRDEPIPAITLTLFLEVLAEHCGADLLRLKGIINIAENPDRPAVIHGVQHVFHPPVWLDRWPSEDRRSRLVLIGHHLSKSWTTLLLEAIDTEVREVASKEMEGEGVR